VPKGTAKTAAVTNLLADDYGRSFQIVKLDDPLTHEKLYE
jgi:hypothetical protein